jgi:hypothetical protein
MEITELVVTIRIPSDQTKDDLLDMINKKEILEWIPRENLKLQNPIAEAGSAPDEKVVRVFFQNPK